IYQRDKDGVWSFFQKLTPEVRTAMDRFGSDIAIDEDYIAVAAPNYEVNGLPTRDVSSRRYAGAIYINNLPGTNSAEDAIQEGNDPLKLYPNPARESFNLEYAGIEEIETVHAFDYSGRQVNVNYAQGQSAVSTKSLSPGVYLIKVQLENGE
ncbi:unnamed protein product, partial [Ectocarpus fasciculatus]